MTTPAAADIRLVRDYLLGRLAERATAEFEDRLVADGALFEWVETALDDLDDDYVGGRFSTDERRRYEERYRFTQEGRARVGFARTLGVHFAAGSTAPEPSPPFLQMLIALVRRQRPVFQFAITAAGIVLLAAPPFAALRLNQLERKLHGLRTDLGVAAAQTRAAADSAESERARRTAAERRLAALTTASFDLFPGTQRGDNPLATGRAADVVKSGGRVEA